MELEKQIVTTLRTICDPEIQVNIYDLGLVYDVNIDDNKNVTITMSLTSPACPVADFIVEDIKIKIESIPEVTSVEVKIVFEPKWNQEMMSEEARLEMGFL
ncbi:MAG: iron-sulfur cluster assembly protein [Candidatus Azobacteroides pseudotrichonymphae]|jgi:FeS assembly SUF system protein|uniref:MIP18 family-like domain-containing protein n=1 Tax=Azobacteroides pseudotrichonymphae genomovar. CFP2 TaxID=511995 RepID=B6YQL3_AZOPC|nr:iron-sulfur cluster assembly protein [Candidatus Azobacteroides pseudotrichonymphae]BAG83485.1 conserved hypothetical protein [Candidatus Azobacteroides pseudotrichonymphae genomovar. CFP2]GMO32957.1 MAG: iron-sulfur cluster assembly protein [Candidatus Azobacteroides pseudotrichonymphae]